jgi:prepilin-type N-terminal cleavage/methylation domain-containing protein
LKKAFTLIELLVVIAIIAILAAILFPVFAQAKLAAKKAQSISNQKQLGLGILLYTNDYDDLYPREDGCTLNDSYNPVFDNQPAGSSPNAFCNGHANPGKYAFRDNFYSWGKWILPYTKSQALSFDPVVQYSQSGFATDGEVDGGYALNIALTGELDAWPKLEHYGMANPFLGGATTAVPSPAEAMLLMDQITYSVVGPYEAQTTSNKYDLTVYPIAVKEHWEGYFYQPGGTGPCGEIDGTVDTTAAPYTGTVPLSYTDGHTKAIAIGQFLANTPTAAQYGLAFSAYEFCGTYGEYYASTNPSPTPSWTQPWPMWALQ